jgi:anthranilate phosphoribosyltransferase
MPLITPNEALVRCIEHREIFHDEMLELMRMLMRGEVSPQLSAALLMGCASRKKRWAKLPQRHR